MGYIFKILLTYIDVAFVTFRICRHNESSWFCML